MTLNNVYRILRENNINESMYLILPQQSGSLFPDQLVEGPLILARIDDDHWRVVTNERGILVFDETYESGNDAFQAFVRTLIGDPTTRNDFRQSDLGNTYEDLQAKCAKILAEYGLGEEPHGATSDFVQGTSAKSTLASQKNLFDEQ